jgi:co-chaperonin GroES (HSP10)
MEYPDDWTPYTPLRDSVILRPLNTGERKSTGGLIIPDGTEVAKAEGIVLAVGPGVSFDIPVAVLKRFVAGLHQTIEGIELITGALERACAPTPPAFAVGDVVFFPPWLAQWERHQAIGLEFCCIHAGQILGVYQSPKNWAMNLLRTQATIDGEPVI